MKPLSGKTAIVTGASRGIGAAIGHRLAESGARVALLARNLADLEAVSHSIRTAGHEAAPFVCDVTSSSSVESAIGKVTRELGAPLLLVNNAGYGGPFHRTDEVSNEEWELVFATNVRAAFFFSRQLLPVMKDAGFGRVVNVASILGLAGAARSSTYSAAKHALIGYTKSLAQEWGRYGITVNALCPGYVNTGMRDTEGAAPESALFVKIPAGRLAQAAEVAHAAEHLCLPETGYVTGSCHVIDGGLLAAIPE